jgi:hypothetical protein
MSYKSNSGYITSSGYGHTIVPEVAYKEDVSKINDRLSKIEERLCILSPSFELHDKYPALKEAYEAYRIIEGLVNENSKK